MGNCDGKKWVDGHTPFCLREQLLVSNAGILVAARNGSTGRRRGSGPERLVNRIVGGKLRLAAQDIQNADMPHGLTQGPLRGGYNGRFYDSEEVLFDDDRWHCVEAYFKLNTLDLENDRPNRDGIVRAWFDGRLVVERTDVVLRSTDFPGMKFNQFLMAPYFGSGLLPHAQKLWIDELAVGTQRIGPLPARKGPAGRQGESTHPSHSVSSWEPLQRQHGLNEKDSPFAHAQPLRYSRRTNRSASGQLVTLKLAPSHSSFLPARNATFPKRTVSVRAPA
jgi:hypothetical protein